MNIQGYNIDCLEKLSLSRRPTDEPMIIWWTVQDFPGHIIFAYYQAIYSVAKATKCQ